MSKKVIVVGGGWAGCAAAISARKAGAEVELYERTDLLLGLGNVGGIMRNNGRYTASEELIALGGGDLIKICDEISTHRNIDFPGHKHATLYDVNNIEAEVKKYILSLGIKVFTKSRIVDIEMENKKITGVYLADGTLVKGDVFIETTGSTGPMGNCYKYGNGCSMCVLRCPAYGPRVSLTTCAGLEDIKGERADEVYGAFSGSCKLAKESLSKDIQDELNTTGVVVLPVPKEDINFDKLKAKVCQQYALKEFAENVILLDTGHAKLMSSYYPLDKLRKIKGLENAKYVDPYAGDKGNSIRYLSSARRSSDMRVIGIENLFCAGEKAGLFVGHTEAICTGTLAGHNAVRLLAEKPMLILPKETVIGDIISFSNYRILKKGDRTSRFTFAGSIYFDRMKKLGMYTLDIEEIKDRVEKLELTNVFEEKIL